MIIFRVRAKWCTSICLHTLTLVWFLTTSSPKPVLCSLFVSWIMAYLNFPSVYVYVYECLIMHHFIYIYIYTRIHTFTCVYNLIHENFMMTVKCFDSGLCLWQCLLTAAYLWALHLFCLWQCLLTAAYLWALHPLLANSWAVETWLWTYWCRYCA